MVFDRIKKAFLGSSGEEFGDEYLEKVNFEGSAPGYAFPEFFFHCPSFFISFIRV